MELVSENVKLDIELQRTRVRRQQNEAEAARLQSQVTEKMKERGAHW